MEEEIPISDKALSSDTREPAQRWVNDGEPGHGDKYTVGVLFVHGIGEQTEGDTLLRFAEPVAGWIKRWVERDLREDGSPEAVSRSSVELGSAVLKGSQDGSNQPAHTVMHVNQCVGTADIDDSMVSSTWLLAESWWASDFRRPPFAQLARWMLTVGSWVILSHAGKFMRTRERSWAFWPIVVVTFLLFSLMSALTPLAIVTLLVLSGIPIGRLQKALSRVLEAITGSVGDCFVLLDSPFQRSAALTKIRQCLDWLSRQCHHVVVVAHSQGAAMAHEALQRPGQENVELFISFGSGLEKLTELRALQLRHKKLLRLAGFSIPLFALSWLFYPYVYYSFLALDAMRYVELLVLTVPWILIVAAFVAAFRGLPNREMMIGSLSLETARPSMKWIDYFSTADPVPNGPLGDRIGAFDWIDSRRVRNLASLVRDHNAYWVNQDEFVGSVVGDIDAKSQTGLFSPAESAAFKKMVPRARARRVRVLFLAKIASTLGLVASLYGLWNQLASIGERLFQFLEATPVLKSVTVLLSKLGTVLGSLVEAAGCNLTDARTFGLGILGALFPVLVYLVWSRILLVLWEWWSTSTFHALFGPPLTPIKDLSLAVSVSGLAALYSIIGFMTVRWPEPTELLCHLWWAPVILLGLAPILFVIELLVLVSQIKIEK